MQQALSWVAEAVVEFLFFYLIIFWDIFFILFNILKKKEKAMHNFSGHLLLNHCTNHNTSSGGDQLVLPLFTNCSDGFETTINCDCYSI